MKPRKSYIDEDGEVGELDEAWFREAKPASEIPELARVLKKHGRLGRPPLPEEERKQRVTIYLDRDVVAKLKEDGRGWQTRANRTLRAALGI